MSETVYSKDAAEQVALAVNFSVAIKNIHDSLSHEMLIIALRDGNHLSKETLANLANISHLSLKAKKILDIQLSTYNEEMGKYGDTKPEEAKELQEAVQSHPLLNMVEHEYNQTNHDQLVEILSGMGIDVDGHSN